MSDTIGAPLFAALRAVFVRRVERNMPVSFVDDDGSTCHASPPSHGGGEHDQEWDLHVTHGGGSSSHDTTKADVLKRLRTATGFIQPR